MIVHPHMSWVRAAVIVALALAGCTADVGRRIDHAASIAADAHLLPAHLSGGPFTLLVYRRIADPLAPVTVYIEGDGTAWTTRTRLSPDPTPREATGLRLAAADPGPNVLYIARPCQFGGVTSDRVCAGRYWSSHRFAPEVVAATGAVLDTALARFGGRGVDLVGYSGGGAVAALLAARRTDVRSLRTVAGNLDHDAVNRHHGVSPLSGSLNPIAEAGRLAAIPQIHFSGAEDTVVPTSIARSFAQAVGPCARVRVVEGATHGTGWADTWPRLLAEGPGCG